MTEESTSATTSDNEKNDDDSYSLTNIPVEVKTLK